MIRLATPLTEELWLRLAFDERYIVTCSKDVSSWSSSADREYLDRVGGSCSLPTY
jgi:hypothetical protein